MDVTNQYGQPRNSEEMRADPQYATLSPERKNALDILAAAYEIEASANEDEQTATAAVNDLMKQCQAQRIKMAPRARSFLDEWRSNKEAYNNPNYKPAPPDPAIAAMQDVLDELERRLAIARDFQLQAHNTVKQARTETVAAIMAWQRSAGAPMTQTELLQQNARQQHQNRADIKEGKVQVAVAHRHNASPLDAARLHHRGPVGWSGRVGRRGAFAAADRGRVVIPKP